MDAPIETIVLVGLALSVLAWAGGVVIVGIVLVRLPAGYLDGSADPQPLLNAHWLVRRMTQLLKNFLGYALVLVGLLMAVPGMPGPGIITILLGLMLLDFAGKRDWARWVMRRPLVLRAANQLRRKYGKPPFVMPPATDR